MKCLQHNSCVLSLQLIHVSRTRAEKVAPAVISARLFSALVPPDTVGKYAKLFVLLTMAHGFQVFYV